ncbi:MAG: hypothetical protein WDZ93_03160 [Candidatus Paceibacterota bacterium]
MKLGNTGILFLAAIGALIISVLFIVLLLNVTDETKEGFDTMDATETTTWVTYENETYNFSLEHPSDWRINVSEDEPGTPKINVYPPETDTSTLPFTHHSEEVTHVSVFPHGIPTEGFFGEATESSVDLSVPVERASDFVLDDGIPFATIAFLNTDTNAWTESGFLFAHVRVADQKVICMREGEELPANACDPLMGDTLVRSGSIDSARRAATVRILESFTFTEE